MFGFQSVTACIALTTRHCFLSCSWKSTDTLLLGTEFSPFETGTIASSTDSGIDRALTSQAHSVPSAASSSLGLL